VLKKAGVPLVPLTNFSSVIETAAEMKYISKKDLQMLNDWHKNPSKWKK
jgi:orotate phosphoribosyltransferase